MLRRVMNGLKGLSTGDLGTSGWAASTSGPVLMNGLDGGAQSLHDRAERALRGGETLACPARRRYDRERLAKA